jgi:hypothetical protein
VEAEKRQFHPILYACGRVFHAGVCRCARHRELVPFITKHGYEIHAILVLVALIHRPSPRRVSHRSGNRSVEAKSSPLPPPFPSLQNVPAPARGLLPFALNQFAPSGFEGKYGNYALGPLRFRNSPQGPYWLIRLYSARQARVTPFPEMQDGPG